MARYIDADRLIADGWMLERHGINNKLLQVMSIADVPTEDVEEVKHGKWEEWWDDNYLSYCHKCSECGSYPLTKEETMHDEVLSNFCPNCGTKMDGTQKERGADKPKITCLNCKHLIFSDMYGECNKQLRIVNPGDTCEYGEPKERGGEK